MYRLWGRVQTMSRLPSAQPYGIFVFKNPGHEQVEFFLARRFLREIHISEVEAFEKFRLAPLPVRRDISMLGLLYRICHGLAPSSLCSLFPWKSVCDGQHSARGALARHDLQLVKCVDLDGRTETWRRSCFGLTTVWNALPGYVAKAKSAKICQKLLQKCVANRMIQCPDFDWQHFFTTGARVIPVHSSQRLF